MSIKEQALLYVVMYTCRNCDEMVVMPRVPLEGTVEFAHTIACQRLCTIWTNVLSMRYNDEGVKVALWAWEATLRMDDYDDWSGP